MYWISAKQGPESRLVSRVLLGLAFSTTLANAQQLTDGQINVMSARLAEAAQESWELGTRAQTILELNATQYSVFTPSPLPPPTIIPKSLVSLNALAPFFEIAKTLVYNRSMEHSNASGPQPLMPDGSAGDPSSMGVAVLLANWTGQDNGQMDYAGAAKDQVDFLLNVVPRTSDGAISHRIPELQLWSDFIYMVPPFLAYYGVLTRNRSVIAESYNQIKLYRGHLQDSSTGLWQHVLLGPTWNDPGFWCTGQGWAAAGILRVYSTIQQSEYSNTFANEKSDLASWITEIHTAIYPHLDDTNIFGNYPDQPIASDNFYDAACTTLLASTVYRAAQVINDVSHISFADRSRKTLFNSTSVILTSNSSSTIDGYAHFTTDGWLQPVVDPHSFRNPGNNSAEGQAFVIQLNTAYRDYIRSQTSAALAKGGVGLVRLGSSGPARLGRSSLTVAVVIGALLVML